MGPVLFRYLIMNHEFCKTAALHLDVCLCANMVKSDVALAQNRVGEKCVTHNYLNSIRSSSSSQQLDNPSHLDSVLGSELTVTRECTSVIQIF